MFDIKKYETIAIDFLSPIKPIDEKTKAPKYFLHTAMRSKAGIKLPEFYLIYFLFGELLKYRNLGRFEKVAWSFPIDYNGKAFLIEFRKFGIGVFIQEDSDEKDASEIVKKINKTVKSIKPYFDYLAEEAVKTSKFTIVNNNRYLFNRFDYFKAMYKKEYKKYLKYKDETKKTVKKTKYGEVVSYTNLGFKYIQKANWIAIACIEAFFSWTEHLFIHLAVISNNVSDGIEVSNLISSEWKDKFNRAITDDSKERCKFYTDLLLIRQQLRNYVAHGAFGKNGNAYSFHSNTGAVPVIMQHNKLKNRFSLCGELSFNEFDVITLIVDFIKYLWKGSLAPAMYYTQECWLPTILTYASDGTYTRISKDMDEMVHFSDSLMRMIDDSTNMDW
jgi:hypothetical protein